MKERIHRFQAQGQSIVLDVNSGAVHVVDAMVYDMMGIFNGTNADEVLQALQGKYDVAELQEALTELHSLMDAKELFAPDIDVPPSFKSKGLVKSMCLMVAQDCNLRCKYCFAGTGDYGGQRALMSEEVGKAAVDYIIAHSGPRRHCEIDFFGGEPLLNMKTVKAVTAYVRQREKETGKQFKLTLTTNGMLLNPANRQWLNENHISLVLSLDGRQKVHDAMRPDVGGHGSYARALKNFQAIVKERQGENYYLRGTYTKANMDFTDDVLDMHDQGFDILSVEPVVAKDAPYGFTEEDLPRLYAEYDRLTEAYLQRHREGRGFFFFHFNMDLSNGPCVAKRLAGCGAGHEYYAVAEDGSLYPCHQFVGREKYRLGNVFDGVEKDSPWPQYFRESHVLNKKACRDCWARFFCSGGCHANADLFHGDIREPYELGCALQKKRLECAILVQAMLALEKMNAQA